KKEKKIATHACISSFLSFALLCALDPDQPELTVQNLPWYLELRKPMLIMFVGEDESPETSQSLEEMRTAERTGRLDSAQPCWIHL
ncbi:thioredoxin domain-containing protein 16 isoform X1, partial [Clarias magur]